MLFHLLPVRWGSLPTNKSGAQKFNSAGGNSNELINNLPKGFSLEQVSKPIQPNHKH